MIRQKDIKRILIFNVNWVGDVIFSTPIFKALKERFVDCHVVCVAVPRVIPVLEACPFIDEIIVYDERGQHRSLWGKIKIIRAIRRARIDVAFVLHRSWTRALLLFLAGIPERVGYNTKNRGWMLTRPIDLLADSVHRSDFYCRIIEAYGIGIDDRVCRLEANQKDLDSIDKLLEQNGIKKNESFVVVNMGGNWDLKRWPREHFATLIKRMVMELDCKIVLPGIAKDKKLAQEVVGLAGVEVVNMVGKTDLRQLIALMSRASLVISADSGPMHIANCLGIPVVALFGPTRPEITGPRGRGLAVVLQEKLDCNDKACYRLDCTDNLCMKNLTADQVFERVKEEMKRC